MATPESRSPEGSTSGPVSRHRTKWRDRRDMGVRSVVATVLPVAVAVVSLGVVAVRAHPVATAACTQGQRDDQLEAAQHAVLALVDDLATIEDAADLSRLAALGYSFYPHQMVSLEGMGWPVLDTLAPQDPDQATPIPSRPTLLLFAPTTPIAPGTVTEPRDGFDFPYHLAGWAYLFPYDFAEHPTVGGDGGAFLPCLEREEWFVHERALHPFDSGAMKPIPPDEDHHGTSPGNAPPHPESPGDIPHGRAWDVHLWLDEDNVPAVSALNPGAPIPGVDAHVGTSPPGRAEPDPWFFYPRQAADLSVAQADSPDPVRRGERLTYTITVANKGPHTATEVALTDKLPKHTANHSVTPSQGGCAVSEKTVSCDLGEITNGAFATVTIVVRPTTEGWVENAVWVSAKALDLTKTEQPEQGELWTDAEADNMWTERTTVLR